MENLSISNTDIVPKEVRFRKVSVYIIAVSFIGIAIVPGQTLS
jgi:hypothetical protein